MERARSTPSSLTEALTPKAAGSFGGQTETFKPCPILGWRQGQAAPRD